MNMQQFEKMLTALEKSPNACLAHKRHLRVHKFLLDNVQLDTFEYDNLKHRIFASHQKALNDMVA